MNTIWRYLRGPVIIAAIIVLLALVFNFIELYGAYLKWLGVSLVITFIIVICIIIIVSVVRMFNDFHKHPPASGAET